MPLILFGSATVYLGALTKLFCLRCSKGGVPLALFHSVLFILGSGLALFSNAVCCCSSLTVACPILHAPPQLFLFFRFSNPFADAP